MKLKIKCDYCKKQWTELIPFAFGLDDPCKFCFTFGELSIIGVKA